MEILVVSPHPDDESLGCGGTLRHHVIEGDRVRVVFLTSGEAGGHGLTDTGTAREDEAAEAAAILGLHSIEFWRESDGALRATGKLADRLRGEIEQSNPDLIYAPHEGEMHTDHRAAFRALKTALAPLVPESRPRVLLYEVWTPMQRMDEIVDITPFIEDKLAAIRAYKSQCHVLKFDDAFLGLSRYRGEMHSWPGGEYAEIFTYGRG